MDISIENKFGCFCKENPLQYTEEQFHKIEQDILHPRDGVVCDEYVDFMLWSRGLKFRQQYFGEYIEKVLPHDQYPNLLEVGCGEKAVLAQILTQKGYCVTAMDPQLATVKGVKCVQAAFVFGKINLQAYDAVIAQEPCDATEHIIRACAEQCKNFIIGLCGVPHRFISGEMPADVYEWFEYLQQIAPDNIVLIWPELIPGYMSPMLVGAFSK